MNKTLESVKGKLIELGFFKYVSKDNLDKAIEETFKGYAEDGIIQFSDDFLNRLFYIDAEHITEGYGIKSQIEGMLDLFEAIGINIEIGKYVEEFDVNGEYSARKIQINNQIYEADLPTDWESGFDSGVKLIKEILEDNHNKDSIYGLFMDESSTLILLDDNLYDYLIELIPKNATYRPINL
jgi:hypothetical protein